MKKFKIVALVTMLVLSLGIGSAYAHVENKATLVAANIFGGTTPAATTFANSGNGTTVVYTITNTIAASTQFLVNITLTNGAFLAADAPVAADLTFSDDDRGTVTVSGGSASNVQYTVTASQEINENTTMTFTTPTMNGLSALGTVGAKVTATVTFSNPFFGTIETASGTILTSGNPYTGAFAITAGTTSKPFSGTIDVAQDLFYFSNATTPFIGNDLVELGTLTWTAVAGNKGTDGGTDIGTLTTDVVTATITGSFGSAKTADATTGGVFLGPSGCGTVTKKATSVNATTAVFDSTGAVFTTGTAISVCLQVIGTTAIESQTPTGVSSRTSVAIPATIANPKAVAATTPGTLRTLSTNGKTRKVYNIASPGSETLKAYVHIINTGVIAGKIRGTLTLADGQSFTGTIHSSLAPGVRVVLTSDQIAAALAGVGCPATWTGKARLVVNGDISGMEVQNTVLNTIGGVSTQSNFSSVSPE